ncbi:hypothetical protein R1sor_018123 [Riccia sorocarpa]|uniref:Uncharacterized protein n=1 Tax=Riccia sorocarpa TaxID=122646 RepID=A0ABD3I975_9MARC
MFLGGIPRRPDKGVAYNQLKQHLTVLVRELATYRDPSGGDAIQSSDSAGTFTMNVNADAGKMWSEDLTAYLFVETRTSSSSPQFVYS